MYSGASLDIRDNEGETALGWALDGGRTQIAEALRAAGGSRNLIANAGYRSSTNIFKLN